ncbi:MAG: replicative DNA helicase [Herpetosiphonaceae bacterium]|nr:MAG: replicative DNA helicase [Herpetosiphonaceae bacterium]
MDKPLPSDLNAERAALGSIFLDRDAIIAVAPWLQPDYFYLERHAWIYEAQLACYNRRVPPDLINVADELRRRERLEAVGGAAYLVELSNSVPTAVHIEYYARIVERTALLRRLIQAGGKIAALGYNESEDIEAVLDKAESELFAIAQRRAGDGFVHISAIVDDIFQQISHIQERGGEVVGIPTGFRDLDALTGGLQRSDLIILAARPATGKSSLALSIAYNVALHQRVPVGFFALEMGREQLVQRILATHTGLDMQRLRTGNIRDSELQIIMDAMGMLSSLPIYIDDTPGLSVMEVRSKARRLQAEAGLELLIIDYLQLMSGRRNENRVQEVSEISRGLKALARELNIPVVALSQLSRAVEGRQSRVPMLSDLRESGCLAGESLVYLPDQGIYRRIDSLVGQSGFNVLALNTETWQFEPRPVLKAFATGYKPVYRLTTRLGRSIRATANHKFLTMSGWRRLDELQPGMRLALPRRLPGPAEATMSDAELALLGHIIGDGCAVARQPIHYTSADEDLARMVAELARQVFGEAVAPRVSQERGWYQVYLASSRRLTHGVRNPVAAWLDSLGLFDLRSYEKFVPDCVFAQPAGQIAIFLRHLWATDGCIQYHGDKPYPTMYYASSSLQLARNVQSLLLRLGINATLSSHPQGQKGRHQYHVDVSGMSEIIRFLEVVGAVGAAKVAHKTAILQHLVGCQEKTGRDIIPREVWNVIVEPDMGAASLTKRQALAVLGYSEKTGGISTQNLSRERAASFAAVARSPQLAQLAVSDVYWDEIISIEPDGECEVFDLTVEGLHNFVAGDCIVHNSIEQDADIVMFIYREELYDPDTDKKGIAEIHLAKHRNGPTGIVPLRFFSHTTRFADLERFRQPEGY